MDDNNNHTNSMNGGGSMNGSNGSGGEPMLGSGGKMSHFLLEDDFDNKKRFTSAHKRIFYMLTSLMILATVVLLIVFLLPRGWEPPRKKINIIMMVGDGMGGSAITLARESNKQLQMHLKVYDGLLPVTHLKLDPYLVGTVQTYSSNSIVTDSAAAATAYASGVKTLNLAIGVDSNKKPVGTIMEAAKASGMKTGLVVTTRISDATPACYFSHSVDRHDEQFIIDQLLEKQVDIVLGGGLQYFRDQVLVDAKNLYNYTMVNSTSEMNKVESGKIMGLFSHYNLPWEIDRLNNEQLKSTIPSLQEMTRKALELINQDNENGFLLMVEGSKIDVAAHINDAAAQIWETLAFDETFEIVRQFAELDGNTIVIVTADHETGGLSLGNQPVIDGHPQYMWSPDKLLQVKKSADDMATLIKGGADIDQTLFQNGGVTKLTQQQWIQINSSISTSYLNQVIGKVVSANANIGFTTGGHTGVDVNLYTYGDTISESKFEKRLKEKKMYTTDNYIDTMLRGNINNIDIASFIVQTLSLNIQSITDNLIDFNPQAPKTQ